MPARRSSPCGCPRGTPARFMANSSGMSPRTASGVVENGDGDGDGVHYAALMRSPWLTSV
jgi:hypothetical protein